jgi:hypothetical protein
MGEEQATSLHLRIRKVKTKYIAKYGLQLDMNNILHNASVINTWTRAFIEKLTVLYPRNSTPFTD